MLRRGSSSISSSPPFRNPPERDQGHPLPSLVRAIAYRMQERAQGGFGPAAGRRLRAVAETVEMIGKRGAFDPGISLKPGARLVREWGGRVHTVTILEDGFDYAGQRHRSLTRIASLITGAHWPGPRFFGIRKPGSGATASVEFSDE